MHLLLLPAIVKATVIATTIVAAHWLLWLAKSTKLCSCSWLWAGHFNAMLAKTLDKWLPLLLELTTTLHQEKNILYKFLFKKAACALVKGSMDKINSSLNVADPECATEKSGIRLLVAMNTLLGHLLVQLHCPVHLIIGDATGHKASVHCCIGFETMITRHLFEHAEGSVKVSAAPIQLH